MIMGLHKREAMGSDTHQFQFVAGHLALDFVNTVAFRADPAKTEDRLLRGEDVLWWAGEAGLPDLAAISAGPRMGTAGLQHIRKVREQLFAVFHAVASGGSIP